VASTQNGPVTRVIFAVTSGLSTSTSCFGGSLFAIDSSVMCGTIPPNSLPLRF